MLTSSRLIPHDAVCPRPPPKFARIQNAPARADLCHSRPTVKTPALPMACIGIVATVTTPSSGSGRKRITERSSNGVASTTSKNVKVRKHRQARIGEVVCLCRAYAFPHRFSGGACNGSHWVALYFDPCDETCRTCPLNDRSECQVMQGLERPRECPALQEYVDLNNIKLKRHRMRYQGMQYQGNRPQATVDRSKVLR